MKQYRKCQVIMYHGVSKFGGYGTISINHFKKQILFLSNYYKFIKVDEFLGQNHSKRELLLTFDDGYHNNYEYVVPFLKKLNLPAVFFVSPHHCNGDNFLWFSYLKALQGFFPEDGFAWRGRYYDFKKKTRNQSYTLLKNELLKLTPHPSEMYKAIYYELPKLESFVPQNIILEYFKGMTNDELHKISNDNLFSLGLHTMDHVFLTKCTDREAKDQIRKNMDFIHSYTSGKFSVIAYPSGDYDERILEICSKLGIHFGFSVQPKRKNWNQLDIPRFGIYSSSILKIIIKLSAGKLLRNLDFQIS